MIQQIETSMLPERIYRAEGMPKCLFIRSNSMSDFRAIMQRPRVAIVGSRALTTYGEATTHRFATELAAQGIVIVSGLALGIDAIAHRAALEAGGLTMAVLPSGINTVYPRRHTRLANEIIEQGGVLVSEYPGHTPALIHHFVERNRIVAGLADAVLITEAAEHSGSLYTARFALRQCREVLAVPGDITSPTSEGTNNLIKSSGAALVTNTSDVLFALGLTPVAGQESKPVRIKGDNPQEQQILDLLERGISDGNELFYGSGLAVEQFNHHLTMLEITAKIRALGANHWALA
jgi:DNA processing protein